VIASRVIVRLLPIAPGRLGIRGVPHRIRLINTSNTRFMRVSIDGFRMFRIGGDGWCPAHRCAH
jgi:FtsP/CotA-like multicopper oxidase with cupredoxin domain